MKNNIFISLLVAVVALCYSCSDEPVPTNDSIVYDKIKVPTITSNIDLETEMPVDSIAIWDVDIEAFNGIDTIFLNDSVIHTFGDGQLKYNGIEITMPVQEEYEVKLSVKDEIGLETIYPSFTIEAKDRPTITSNVELASVMFVDSIVIWDVDIYASNGIDTIFLNGSAIHTYKNIRKIHKGIEITMPGQEGDYEILLSINDKIGLETIYPSFKIAVKEKPVVPYDPKQKPIITSNVALETEMLVGATVTWDVDINAFNGIDTIFLNGSAIHTYENRQKTHSGIEITMPDQDLYDVILSVKDEIGLETIYPPFTIMAKGRIASPFLIFDFTTVGATVIGIDSGRRPLFPKANAVEGNSVYSANAGWMDAVMESDLENQTTIRYGAPAMNTANNADKWKHISTFGVDAPLKEGNQVSALMIRHHFKDVALDGNVSVNKWKFAPTFFLNKFVFDAPLLEPLVADVVDGKRVVKIDIYVDTRSTDDTDPNAKYNFNFAKHSMVALGMANVAKFNNTTSKGDPRSGQDHGMVAHITRTDAWETLTFMLDPSNTFVHTNTALALENNEVDMFTLFISAQTVKTGNVTNTPSNAKYYLSNLRVEKVIP